jgi:hypothetical protein
MNLTKTLSIVVMCIFLIGAILGCNPQPNPAPQAPPAGTAAPAESPAAPPAESPAAPAGEAVQDPEVISATTLMYDNVSKGDVEKLTGELLKKEMAEKVKAAKPEELGKLGDLGAVLLVTTMVKDKTAVVGFKDLKVTVTKLEGDKAEVKVEGMAASKMTIDGKEEVNEKQITDNVLLEKEDGKWKIVGVSGEKKTETEVKPEVKPEGDAPKTEGEAPKTEGEPKADAPKTEGETK